VSTERGLIVNADDFGVTAGVSRGILDAVRHGIVRSTTAMVNLPGEADLDADAASLRGLGIGLHLNLTWGRPVAPADRVPSLIDGDGRFTRDPAAVAARAAADDVRREAEAQLEAFARRFGRTPTHIDGHHHVHRHPGVREVVAELALEVALPLRSQDAGFRDGLRRRGIRTPGHFVGGDDPAPYWTVARLLDSLAALPVGEVTELMCHPGYFDAALAYSRYGREREVELAALRDPEVRATIERLDIRLCGFADLPAPG
jgi:predicted glycoside hydrolase/deacetylase ChbG (UPF0249 family)